LLKLRRTYRPEWEPILFDIQRVFDYLATFTFDRKVNRNGQVTLKGLHYTVGLCHAGKDIQVRFDPTRKSGFSWKWMRRGCHKNFVGNR
jgi:hypothetical protein